MRILKRAFYRRGVAYKYTDPEQKQLDCRNNSLPGGSGSDSGPPASSLGAAGQSPSSHRCRGSAPGPASSRLRPPSREARSTFRRKRVRTLGGSVGLCCHGTSTFEGQGGVTGNTTWAVRVRNPEPVARRSGRFRPVSAQAGDQWPPCWPLVSCLFCTQHVTHLYGRVPSPFPTTSARPDRGLCSCLGTVTLDCLSCRLPLKALVLTPCWGNV